MCINRENWTCVVYNKKCGVFLRLLKSVDNLWKSDRPPFRGEAYASRAVSRAGRPEGLASLCEGASLPIGGKTPDFSNLNIPYLPRQAGDVVDVSNGHAVGRDRNHVFSSLVGSASVSEFI